MEDRSFIVPFVVFLFSFLPFLPLVDPSPLSPQAANAGPISNAAAVAQGKPASEGSTTFDGVSLANIKAAPAPEAVVQSAISQSGWTVTCDSVQAGNPCSNAIDGTNTTFWHTQYTPSVAPLPHTITVDMKQSYQIGSITYTPRQDGNLNGNIGGHTIQVSTDGTTFTAVAYGLYYDDNSMKTTTFTAVSARYLRLIATTEAGNRGQWTSIAELNVYTATQGIPPASPAGKGSWGPTIDFGLVPVSGTVEWSTGKLLVWSSFNPATFGGSNGVQTLTAEYNPATQGVTQTLVTNTQHDMFCEGLATLFDGRVVATGGNTNSATSFYDSTTDSWTKGPAMKIGRGYQSQATTSTGNVFVIGASWSGGQGGKNGELYNPGANTWSLLSGCPVTPMLTADPQGVYRADNHGMLFGWKNQYVFQAGPSKAMNWYGTTGSGSQAAAGTRGSDGDAMCGNAVMYDAVAGKILVAGGAPAYQNTPATSNANIVTIGNPTAGAVTTKVANMAFTRSFANGVVLPDGKVLILGGQNTPVPFSDAQSVYTPELWDPATSTFTQLANAAIPRNYHSIALLMPDATVVSGGGGLCGVGCGQNHYDAQIFRPPYLYTAGGALATRPAINGISATTVRVGTSFTVTTNVAVTGFSLIRLGTTTHTVDTDQRRIALTPTGTSGTTYTLAVPSDPGVALPGPYYVFVLAGGVPSVARTIKITT